MKELGSALGLSHRVALLTTLAVSAVGGAQLDAPSARPSRGELAAPLSLGSVQAAARPGLGRMRLDDPLDRAFGWNRFRTPSVERPRESAFFRGSYGAERWSLVPRLSLDDRAIGAGLPSPTISAPLLGGDDSHLSLDLLATSRTPSPRACARRPLTIGRYGAEQDTFSLLSCDGEVLPDAIDRLSVLLRPPGVERPELPLPEDPDPDARSRGEWVPGVRLVAPRLLWLLEQVGEAFPRKAIYVMSGYRAGGHEGQHKKGRAIDLYVVGVPNEKLFKFCKRLPDAGCGYYPNSLFVHFDVRKPASGKASWIDVSGPGQPSQYVDTWPPTAASGAAP